MFEFLDNALKYFDRSRKRHHDPTLPVTPEETTNSPHKKKRAEQQQNTLGTEYIASNGGSTWNRMAELFVKRKSLPVENANSHILETGIHPSTSRTTDIIPTVNGRTNKLDHNNKINNHQYKGFSKHNNSTSTSDQSIRIPHGNAEITVSKKPLYQNKNYVPLSSSNASNSKQQAPPVYTVEDDQSSCEEDEIVINKQSSPLVTNYSRRSSVEIINSVTKNKTKFNGQNDYDDVEIIEEFRSTPASHHTQSSPLLLDRRWHRPQNISLNSSLPSSSHQNNGGASLLFRSSGNTRSRNDSISSNRSCNDSTLAKCVDLQEKARFQQLLDSITKSSESNRSSTFRATSRNQQVVTPHSGSSSRVISPTNSTLSSNIFNDNFFANNFRQQNSLLNSSYQQYNRAKALLNDNELNNAVDLYTSPSDEFISNDARLQKEISVNSEQSLSSSRSASSSVTSVESSVEAPRISSPFDRNRLQDLKRRFDFNPNAVCKDVHENFERIQSQRRERAKGLQLEATMRADWRRQQSLKRQEEMKLRLRFEGLFILPDEKEEPAIKEFPELSAEQNQLISKAMNVGNPNELLVEEFSIPIKRRDIQTLNWERLDWLNDEIINFYFNLIMYRSKEQSKLPKAYVFNTFFCPKLTQSGYAAVKRWTRKVDVFDYDLLLAPVHLGAHWCLSVVDFRKKQISYYDSMGGRNDSCMNSLLNYLVEESSDKKKQKFDTSNWELVNVKDIPHQMNGSDCGVFTCKYAEYVSRNAKITFTQKNMPYFRQRMVLEILTKKLL